MQSFAISALSRRLSRKLSLNIFNRQVFKKDTDTDPQDANTVRYKPEGLDALCRSTKFSRKELQIMYRGFKQECPAGIVREETFKDIFAQFFPQGDSATYAHHVFKVFDQDHDGAVSFEEFVLGLSVLARGTIQEKLFWAFSLYDINGDGLITREEMQDIVSAVYDLLGRGVEPTINERTAKDHAETVFQKMDTNGDGFISVDEFMAACGRTLVIEVPRFSMDSPTKRIQVITDPRSIWKGRESACTGADHSTAVMLYEQLLAAKNVHLLGQSGKGISGCRVFYYL